MSKKPDVYSNSKGFTRRDFMRYSALGSGMMFLSGCEALWERQPVIRVDSWHKGVCRFCGTGCGLEIGIKENKVVDVVGDKLAHNRGRLCIKGVMNRDILYADDRALYPMIRQNGKLVRSTWEDAMQLMASKFKEAIRDHGPKSVGYYGSGQLFTEESYTASKLFKAGIGSNNVDGNPRLCMASAAFGYTGVFGIDEPMGCYEDLDHADCFFITGANLADCHPIIWERVLDRKRSAPHTFLIVTDPRKTRTAREADLHLPIIPGTDVTLYNAMINEMLRQGQLDEEMVSKYISFRQGDEERDFGEFKEHIAKYTLERAAATCGIAALDIQEAAYRFATSEASMSLWTMGLNQQIQGTACNQLVMAMHLLTGHIGRPGATPFSLTGQPNAGGGVRDTGALSHNLPTGRKIANEKDRREMEKLWGVPEGSINPEPGYDAVGMFQAMEKGDLKCALIMATNPAQSMPNTRRYREAMEKTFIVAADSFQDTQTSKFADIVLPAAMWVEKEGVFSQSERRYHYVPNLTDAPGEARSDLDIIVDFAERMGYGDLIKSKTPEAVWEEWREISAHSYYNFKGITYARMKKERGFLWPCPDEEHPGTCRRYVPGEDPMTEQIGRLDFYGRPDGRALVYLYEQQPPPENTTEEYPLILTTGRVLEHWHTGTITLRLEELKKIPVDFVEIHPADARALNLANGNTVKISSKRGEANFKVRVTDKIRKGIVFTTFHSAKNIINHATIDAIDPQSKQPAYKFCAVKVSLLTDIQ